MLNYLMVAILRTLLSVGTQPPFHSHSSSEFIFFPFREELALIIIARLVGFFLKSFNPKTKAVNKTSKFLPLYVFNLQNTVHAIF